MSSQRTKLLEIQAKCREILPLLLGGLSRAERPDAHIDSERFRVPIKLVGEIATIASDLAFGKQPADVLEDRQAGFAIGDEVRVIGKYAGDWEQSRRLTISGINRKLQGGPITFTLAEDGTLGLTDGWMADELVRVVP